MKINILLLTLLSVVSAIPVQNNVESLPSLTNSELTPISELSDLENLPINVDDEISIEEEDDSDYETNELNSFTATKDNVKILGRALYLDDINSLWFGLTNTGVEYKFNGKITSLSITADTGSSSIDNPARIVIYADDSLYLDTFTTEVENEFVVEFRESAEHTVRLMKISECTCGTLRLNEIKADSNIIEPTMAASKKIEFIGDSITSAYGIDAPEGTFSSKTEDGTKTYAYKTAQKFNADSSMVSFSGFGIISGYSDNGVRDTFSTVPHFYDKLGVSYFNFYNKTASMHEVEWDANEFKPDLIVINLGTNDSSYIRNIKEEERKISEADAYADEYEKFIGQIRSIHPDAEILCTLGIMGQELYYEVEKAVNNYRANTGDMKVNAFKFNNQDIEKNGKNIDWHPAPQSHIDAAHELVNEIEKRYGWVSDSNVNID
ncbi:carbohydrate esterase family 2 protein [Piromyces sp. E2]|nr:carbohydrate esterase family 2 protein [Piromyces sp. E2]|eukprot:OUM68768.1 carbohydrate esterase family 2 protein [Piromyces sp. E2]